MVLAKVVLGVLCILDFPMFSFVAVHQYLVGFLLHPAELVAFAFFLCLNGIPVLAESFAGEALWNSLKEEPGKALVDSAVACFDLGKVSDLFYGAVSADVSASFKKLVEKNIINVVGNFPYLGGKHRDV